MFDGDSITKLRIARSSRSFITGVTIPMSSTAAQREDKFSGMHTRTPFIIDEGDEIPGKSREVSIRECPVAIPAS